MEKARGGEKEQQEETCLFSITDLQRNTRRQQVVSRLSTLYPFTCFVYSTIRKKQQQQQKQTKQQR